MKIDDEVVRSRLLGVGAYHEEARWCKGQLLHHEEVSFQGVPPKQDGGGGGEGITY